jgi:hypothetical protein
VSRRPDIEVLANASLNLGGETAFQELGFRTVRYLPERTTVQLTPDVRVTRIPTSRIDSMLLIETPDWRVLNLNDCALPLVALGALRRRFGQIDVLLNNYNHAAKLLDFPARSAADVRATQLQAFRVVVDALNPRWVIPFASLHYYRAPENESQNASLLSVDDLVAIDSRVIPLKVGCRVRFCPSSLPQINVAHPAVTEAPRTLLSRGPGCSATELLPMADAFWRRLREQFGPIVRLLPPFVIRIEDQSVDLVSHSRGGASLRPPAVGAAIAAHSEVVAQWFTDPFGTDAFQVGGHFRLLGPNLNLIRILIMMGVMVDGRITPRQLLSRLRMADGWRFLWNRREEIRGLLFRRRLPVGDRV